MTDNQPRVFVIEDDVAVMSSIEAMLAFANVDPCCFETAEQFLEYDGPTGQCIVADLRLPGMSGIELLDKLKNDGRFLPFILITGHGDPDTVRHVADLDQVWFLEKPYQPNELIDSIKLAITS